GFPCLCLSHIRRTSKPPSLLSPFVSLSDNLPDKGPFRLRVRTSILDHRIPLCQPDFQLSILGRNIWVSPHIIPKKECKLFTETSRSPNVDMHSSPPGSLTEIAFCPLRVVGTKGISKTL